jgi:4-hydroxy-tetrahydrodipicolinate reductase
VTLYLIYMNIALIGYGKMGQAIEQMALKRGHHILLKISSANKDELDAAHLKGVDVAIEFTAAEFAMEHSLKCFEAGVSVVCGTTGWNGHLATVKGKANGYNVGFLQASNFSVGVNIFFEINQVLGSLMNGRSEYDVHIEETHHIHKKDAPSGTAITLAEQVLGELESKNRWVLNTFEEQDAVPVIAYRVDEVPGTHKVSYQSAIDSIEIIHTAHNRDGFALGAVLAAEFLVGKKGVFSMKDVLGIRK